jgi:hypothetical protein
MELTPRVTAAIEKYFPQADRAAVVELLAAYGDDPRVKGHEHMCLTILKLSKGQAARVAHLVEAAKRDYRDVMMWASNPQRTYIVGLLRPGPNAPAGRRTNLSLARLQNWKKAGAIVVGGQCLDGSDLRGLYIFTVDSVQAAQELTCADPGIQSGELMFEFHPWITADGLQVGVPKDFLDV